MSLVSFNKYLTFVGLNHFISLIVIGALTNKNLMQIVKHFLIGISLLKHSFFHKSQF